MATARPVENEGQDEKEPDDGSKTTTGILYLFGKPMLHMFCIFYSESKTGVTYLLDSCICLKQIANNIFITSKCCTLC